MTKCGWCNKKIQSKNITIVFYYATCNKCFDLKSWRDRRPSEQHKQRMNKP